MSSSKHNNISSSSTFSLVDLPLPISIPSPLDPIQHLVKHSAINDRESMVSLLSHQTSHSSLNERKSISNIDLCHINDNTNNKYDDSNSIGQNGTNCNILSRQNSFSQLRKSDIMYNIPSNNNTNNEYIHSIHNNNNNMNTCEHSGSPIPFSSQPAVTPGGQPASNTGNNTNNIHQPHEYSLSRHTKSSHHHSSSSRLGLTATPGTPATTTPITLTPPLQNTPGSYIPSANSITRHGVHSPQQPGTRLVPIVASPHISSQQKLQQVSSPSLQHSQSSSPSKNDDSTTTNATSGTSHGHTKSSHPVGSQPATSYIAAVMGNEPAGPYAGISAGVIPWGPNSLDHHHNNNNQTDNDDISSQHSSLTANNGSTMTSATTAVHSTSSATTAQQQQPKQPNFFDVDWTTQYRPLTLQEQLTVAIYNNDIASVDELLHLGVKINAPLYQGVTPLVYSIYLTYYDLAVYLIEKKALPSLPQNTNALFLAAQDINNSAYIIDILVKYNANVNMKHYTDERTPLLEACLSNNVKAMHSLLSYNADPTHIDIIGHTIYHYSVLSGKQDCLHHITEMLYDYIDVNQTTINNKQTPLMYAVQLLNIDTTHHLLYTGLADPDLEDHNGKTVCDMSNMSKDQRFIALFSKKKRNTRISFSFGKNKDKDSKDKDIHHNKDKDTHLNKDKDNNFMIGSYKDNKSNLLLSSHSNTPIVSSPAISVTSLSLKDGGSSLSLKEVSTKDVNSTHTTTTTNNRHGIALSISGSHHTPSLKNNNNNNHMNQTSSYITPTASAINASGMTAYPSIYTQQRGSTPILNTTPVGTPQLHSTSTSQYSSPQQHLHHQQQQQQQHPPMLSPQQQEMNKLTTSLYMGGSSSGLGRGGSALAPSTTGCLGSSLNGYDANSSSTDHSIISPHSYIHSLDNNPHHHQQHQQHFNNHGQLSLDSINHQHIINYSEYRRHMRNTATTTTTNTTTTNNNHHNLATTASNIINNDLDTLTTAQTVVTPTITTTTPLTYDNDYDDNDNHHDNHHNKLVTSQSYYNNHDIYPHRQHTTTATTTTTTLNNIDHNIHNNNNNNNAVIINNNNNDNIIPALRSTQSYHQRSTSNDYIMLNSGNISNTPVDHTNPSHPSHSGQYPSSPCTPRHPISNTTNNSGKHHRHISIPNNLSSPTANTPPPPPSTPPNNRSATTTTLRSSQYQHLHLSYSGTDSHHNHHNHHFFNPQHDNAYTSTGAATTQPLSSSSVHSCNDQYITTGPTPPLSPLHLSRQNSASQYSTSQTRVQPPPVPLHLRTPRNSNHNSPRNTTTTVLSSTSQHQQTGIGNLSATIALDTNNSSNMIVSTKPTLTPANTGPSSYRQLHTTSSNSNNNSTIINSSDLKNPSSSLLHHELKSQTPGPNLRQLDIHNNNNYNVISEYTQISTPSHDLASPTGSARLLQGSARFFLPRLSNDNDDQFDPEHISHLPHNTTTNNNTMTTTTTTTLHNNNNNIMLPIDHHNTSTDIYSNDHDNQSYTLLGSLHLDTSLPSPNNLSQMMHSYTPRHHQNNPNNQLNNNNNITVNNTNKDTIIPHSPPLPHTKITVRSSQAPPVISSPILSPSSLHASSYIPQPQQQSQMYPPPPPPQQQQQHGGSMYPPSLLSPRRSSGSISSPIQHQHRIISPVLKQQPSASSTSSMPSPQQHQALPPPPLVTRNSSSSVISPALITPPSSPHSTVSSHGFNSLVIPEQHHHHHRSPEVQLQTVPPPDLQLQQSLQSNIKQDSHYRNQLSSPQLSSSSSSALTVKSLSPHCRPRTNQFPEYDQTMDNNNSSSNSNTTNIDTNNPIPSLSQLHRYHNPTSTISNDNKHIISPLNNSNIPSPARNTSLPSSPALSPHLNNHSSSTDQLAASPPPIPVAIRERAMTRPY